MLPPLPDIPDALPARCVETAQLSLPPTGFYGYCPTSEGLPIRSHPRPCVSDTYVSAVHASLVNAAQCFGLDERLAFATFNLESGLHITAVGPGADVGIGQLTKPAIDEVNLNAFTAARRQAERSPLASCQALLPLMTQHGAAAEVRCGFMVTPENPARNAIYSLLLIRQNQRAVESIWQRLGIQLPPHINSAALKQKLAMLAYNAGPATPVATLKAYVEVYGSRLTEDHLHFENLTRPSFPWYIARQYPLVNARKRVSKYLRAVLRAARRVELAAGVACFAPDTFPLPPSGPAPMIRARAQAALPLQYMIELAQDFLKNEAWTQITSQRPNNPTCVQRQSHFIYMFAGAHARSAQDLPRELQTLYAQLCDQP